MNEHKNDTLLVIRECNKFLKEETTKKEMMKAYDDVPFHGERRETMKGIFAILNHLSDSEGWEKPFELTHLHKLVFIDFGLLHAIMKADLRGETDLYKEMRKELEPFFLSETLDSFLNSDNVLRFKSLIFEYI